MDTDDCLTSKLSSITSSAYFPLALYLLIFFKTRYYLYREHNSDRGDTYSLFNSEVYQQNNF